MRKGRTIQEPPLCNLGELCCPVGQSLPLEETSLTRQVYGEGGRCGQSAFSQTVRRRDSTLKLQRGETILGEFPWQAVILRKDLNGDNIFVCGASLIGSYHIITAAHCVDRYKFDDLKIRLGEWDIKSENEKYFHIENDMSELYIHPDFNDRYLANDIAVIKLRNRIKFNEMPHISPICLPKGRMNFEGQRCWVSGWGKDSFYADGKYQTNLKKIDVPVITKDKCENYLKRTRLGLAFTLKPGMLCAGGERFKDACKGDGGGPLACSDINGVYMLAGVVSWGIGCGKENVPGVYTDTSFYIDWIRKIIES